MREVQGHAPFVAITGTAKPALSGALKDRGEKRGKRLFREKIVPGKDTFTGQVFPLPDDGRIAGRSRPASPPQALFSLSFIYGIISKCHGRVASRPRQIPLHSIIFRSAICRYPTGRIWKRPCLNSSVEFIRISMFQNPLALESGFLPRRILIKGHSRNNNPMISRNIDMGRVNTSRKFPCEARIAVL